MDIATVDLRYHIIDRLGEGNTGIVFRALDRLTGQSVALKRLAVPFAGQPFSTITPSMQNQRLALAHEFQALASLRHPNIVTVLDYGFDATNTPYLVMELLDNARTIREASQSQSLAIKVDLVVQMLQALAYLHRRGVVHRDLKPANVLVTGQQVKVLDFSLAAAKGQSTGPAGTLNYMAPEILIGQPADFSTDLYSVGVIAFEMFAGHHPYRPTGRADPRIPSSQQLVDHIMRTPPEALTANLDAPVADILNRLLAKNSVERYATAHQAIEAFNALLGQPLPLETAATRESFLQAAQFVGRKRELMALTDALNQALTGQGSAWLIGGESGVGKSRLSDELRVRALIQNVLVLRGQAVSEGGRPYQIWRDALRWLCLQTSLSDHEAGVLKSLVPDINTLLGRSVPDALELDPQATHERLTSVVEDVFDRQKRAILIVLEDLQWCSSEELALLVRISRKTGALPLLIIGNYRDDERATLPDEVPGARPLKLSRLSEGDIAKLSESMLGAAGQTPEVVHLLQRETEGNVFFLIEMVRALAEEAGQLDNIGDTTLPESILTGGVQQFIQRRLSRLTPDVRPLLHLAAIAGRELDLTILQYLNHDIDLTRWLSVCADAAVLEAFGERWSFAHDKLREGLLAELPAELRTGLHEQVGLAIEASYPDTSEHTVALVHHWTQAKNKDKAAHYTLLAGEQAVSRGAYGEAIRFLENGLALFSRSISDWQLALAEYHLGMAYYGLANMEASREHMWRALKQLGQRVPATRPELYATLVQQLLLQIARPARALMRYSTQPRESLLLATRICTHLSEIGYFTGPVLPTVLETIRSVNLAEAAGTSPELARAYAHLTLALGLTPFHRMAQSYSQRALVAARADGQPYHLAYSLYVTGVYQSTIGNWEQSISACREALELFETLGDRRRWREVMANIGYTLGLQGQFAESFNVRKTLEASAQREDDVQARGWGLAGMGEMSVWMHHPEDALHYLQARLDLMDQFTAVMDPSTTSLALMALLYWRIDQPEQAQAVAERGLEHMAVFKQTSFHTFQGFASLAEVFLQLWETQPDDSRLAQASRRVTQALRSYARPFPVYHAWAWRNQGTYSWLVGKRVQAVRSWQKSLTLALRFRMPYEEALARYEIARHLAANDPRRKEHLARAVELFARLGAAYDLTQALRLPVTGP